MDFSDMNKMIQQMLEKAMGASPERKKKLIAKLDPEFIAQHEEVVSKAKAFDADMKRISAKIQGQRDRMWLDIQDKYDAHSKSLTIDDGNLYEYIGEEEK